MTRDELRLELLKVCYRHDYSPEQIATAVKCYETELFPEKPAVVPEDRQTLSLPKKGR